MNEAARPALVCVSHLWWDWVWQRPQQLMTRLAGDYRVLYVEEPRVEIGAPHEAFGIVPEPSGVDVARLVLRSDPDRFWERLESAMAGGGQAFAVSRDITVASLTFVSDEQPRLEREVRAAVEERRSRPLILWLYTPLALGFVELLQPDLVVYDVMDELTSFRFAPPRLRQQEAELLRIADVVFTGGPSIQAVKQAVRPEAHLFPSGVDERHFARAVDPGTPVAPELASLPSPVIGYYGVVDERIDYDLLAAAAASRPEWSWVMVGPLLKVEAARLPRLPNLHYIGKQPYDALPGHLRGFDVAMMPFALSEATRFISPTKTLEYMAGRRPIVSTRVPDVVSLYGSVVRFADDPGTFVREVEAALAEQEPQRERRREVETALLAHHSWDAIARRMRDIVDAAVGNARAPAHDGVTAPER